MKRYVMRRVAGVVTVTVAQDDEQWPLEHLAHKAKALDWARGNGPGAGAAPSDLARSIVGDLIGQRNPSPHLYRRLTLQLARIPHEGGELTEDEVRAIIEAGL